MVFTFVSTLKLGYIHNDLLHVSARHVPIFTEVKYRGWTGGEWRKLHNEELNDLYPSSNIIRVIKSSIIRWAGHVARIGSRDVYSVLMGKL